MNLSCGRAVLEACVRREDHHEQEEHRFHHQIQLPGGRGGTSDPIADDIKIIRIIVTIILIILVQYLTLLYKLIGDINIIEKQR